MFFRSDEGLTLETSAPPFWYNFINSFDYPNLLFFQIFSQVFNRVGKVADFDHK